MTTDHQQNIQKAADHLAAHDPVLAPIIARIGLFTPVPHTDYYWELVDSIISQQLSIKAARTIEGRFLDLFDGRQPQPHELLNKTVDELRAVGLSRAKASYVLDLAAHIAEGTLQLDTITKLSNDEIIKELVAVKGIGEWTAHMFLIFALGRLDVLPTGDLGIRNAIQKVYQLDHSPLPAEIRAIADENQWHPYESIACWYLWQALDNAPV